MDEPYPLVSILYKNILVRQELQIIKYSQRLHQAMYDKYDMVKLEKRDVPLALHDKKCLGLLMDSYHQLESAKTNCRDENCQR